MPASRIDQANQWVILRTGGQRTLALAKSLSDAGLEVWTPAGTVKRRLPRRPGRVERPAPMMPTFVFVRACHLHAVRAILALPCHQHPAFSLFRYLGAVPLLADREIEALRAAERKAVPTRQRPTVAVGSAIRLDEGPFTGMSGVVQTSDGRWTLVAFGGLLNVHIETFLLTGDAVQDRQPIGTAA